MAGNRFDFLPNHATTATTTTKRHRLNASFVCLRERPPLTEVRHKKQTPSMLHEEECFALYARLAHHSRTFRFVFSPRSRSASPAMCMCAKQKQMKIIHHVFIGGRIGYNPPLRTVDRFPSYSCWLNKKQKTRAALAIRRITKHNSNETLIEDFLERINSDFTVICPLI